MLRLSRAGNFLQAAVLSNLRQPAFSRRIMALEAWVGTTLVDRSRRRVRLTAAGRQMLEAGQRALSLIEGERSQILEAESLPDKYVVTFGVQHSIGWRFCSAWLYALEDAFGPVLSRLRADDLPSCMNDLKNGNDGFVVAYESANAADSGATLQSGHFAELESLLIGHDTLMPVSRPDQ